MYSPVLISLAYLLLLFSCASGEEQQLEELQQQVIAVHDEIMPQMSTLTNLKQELSQKNQQLQENGDQEAQDQVIMNEMIIANLDQAHESMMVWMRQFETIESNDDPEASRKYLDDQLAQIQSVKEQMEQAIATARDALN